MTTTFDRRAFVKTTVVAGAGLALAFHLPGCAPAVEAGPGADLNAFLHVKPDGSVVVTAKHMEMGQGTYTGLATILAEELDADWSKVTVVGAPGDKTKYANNFMGMQLTGGSTAIANSWDQMRKAGATARAMLSPPPRPNGRSMRRGSRSARGSFPTPVPGDRGTSASSPPPRRPRRHPPT